MPRPAADRSGLLRAADGTYVALVEHQSDETFAMHSTEAASQVHARLGEVLMGEPAAMKYEVVVDLAKSGVLLRWWRARPGRRLTTELQVAGRCCHGA